MPILRVGGCALEPLGDYLKALGVFRLVAEQVSSEVRCWWEHGIFHLWIPDGARYSVSGSHDTAYSIPTDEAERRAWLETFLLKACEFSPLLGPWQKNTAFLPYDRQKKEAKKAKGNRTIDRDRPGQEALSSLLAFSGLGSMAYRSAIRDFSQDFGRPLEAADTNWVEELKRIDDPQLFEGLNSESEQGQNIGRKSAAQARLIERTRNACDDRRVATWLDTVGHPRTANNRFGKERQWFSLLGDGAAEGSGGMIVRLETALADVLSRRSSDAHQWLAASLWSDPADGHLSDAYSIGLFYPFRKETPNSGQDFESKRVGAAWDVILLFEGVLLFAGSMARRMNARRAAPAFPFYCSSSLGGNPAAGPTEIEGSQEGISSGEVWCPVWNQPATLRDLTALFSEGRMQVSGRDARLATQFIRALGRRGCDRGIAAFQRYGLLRRSGSGDHTSTLAVPLGFYTVAPCSDLELLDEFLDYEEDVLDASGQRAVVNSDSQPRRIISARRRLEDALFEGSRTGLESRRAEGDQQVSDLRLKFMNVAASAAVLERECAVTDGRIHNRKGQMPDRSGGTNVPCAPSLSYDWLRLKHVAPSDPPRLAELFDDGTPEWRLARAVGTICHWGTRPDRSQRAEPGAVGPIRENLVRADRTVRRSGEESWEWEPTSRRAVWLSEREVLSNCVSVLHRRLVDAQAGSGDGLPLFSPYGADAKDVLALWLGQMDDGRLGELLHAFALVRPWRRRRAAAPDREIVDVGSQANGDSGDQITEEVGKPAGRGTEGWLARLDAAAQLPRAYALLKLCFLGGRLPARSGATQTGEERYAPGNLHILNLLLAGRGDEACAAAARRLHEFGYPPLFATSETFTAGFVLSTEDCRRLAGLLLVPITFAADLVSLIIKPTREDHDEQRAILELGTS